MTEGALDTRYQNEQLDHSAGIQSTPKSFTKELIEVVCLWACSTGRRPKTEWTGWRDDASQLAWECLSAALEELEEVAREREAWEYLHKTALPMTQTLISGRKWRDRWVAGFNIKTRLPPPHIIVYMFQTNVGF